MKRGILLSLVSLILLLSLVSAGTVTRSFSPKSISPGDEVEVTLSLKLDGEKLIILVESIPSNFQIIDKGTGDDSGINSLNWVEFQNLKDKEYKYTVKSSSGINGEFQGNYTLGEGKVHQVGGESRVSVEGAGNTTSQNSSYLIIIGIIISLSIIITAFYLVRKNQSPQVKTAIKSIKKNRK